MVKNNRNQRIYEGNPKTYTKQPGQLNGCVQWPPRIAADGSAVGGIYNCFANWFAFDTNGPKAPNAYGHDIFYFSINNKRKIIPIGAPDYNHWEMRDHSQYCSKNSTNPQNGASCSFFAVKNVCPDDPSKTYWECLP